MASTGGTGSSELSTLGKTMEGPLRKGRPFQFSSATAKPQEQLPSPCHPRLSRISELFGEGTVSRWTSLGKGLAFGELEMTLHTIIEATIAIASHRAQRSAGDQAARAALSTFRQSIRST